MVFATSALVGAEAAETSTPRGGATRIGVDLNVAARRGPPHRLVYEAVIRVVARNIEDVRLLLCLPADMKILAWLARGRVQSSPRNGSISATWIDVHVPNCGGPDAQVRVHFGSARVQSTFWTIVAILTTNVAKRRYGLHFLDFDFGVVERFPDRSALLFGVSQPAISTRFSLSFG